MDRLDVRQTQREVSEWVLHNFGNDNPLATFGGMVEEAGEVIRAAVKRSQGIRGTRSEWDAKVRQECADVFIKLCDIAQYEGFDLELAIRERWEEVRQRDWRADPVGHGMPEDEAPDLLTAVAGPEYRLLDAIDAFGKAAKIPDDGKP